MASSAALEMPILITMEELCSLTSAALTRRERVTSERQEGHECKEQGFKTELQVTVSGLYRRVQAERVIQDS